MVTINQAPLAPTDNQIKPVTPTTSADVPKAAAATPSTADKVTISPEAQALANGEITEEDRSAFDSAKTFTYAALGMDHPEKLEQIDDDAYKAGQAFGAAATLIGIGMLL